MVVPVYVWPMELLGGAYADLHGGNVITKGFEMLHATLNNDGQVHSRNTLFFDFETPLVPTGRIQVAASGRSFPGGAEAERSAVVAVMEAFRIQYQKYPADYNFIVISEKRALFNAMRDALAAYRATQGEIESALRDCRAGLNEMCNEISVWLGKRHLAVDSDEHVAVCAFHAALAEQDKIIEEDLRCSDLLVEMVVSCDPEPEERVTFDASVPMPMVVDWERSYYTLRCVYNKAVKKLAGVVSPINVVTLDDGQMKASVDVSAPPFHFSGEPGANRAAAKAKLVYVVIKHVNDKLGFPIMDLHHSIRVHQDGFIARFDRKMKGLTDVAEKLQQLVVGTCILFDESTTELSRELSDTVCAEVVFQKIQVFSSLLRGCAARVDAAFQTLQERKVEASTLEANLAANVDGGAPNAAAANAGPPPAAAVNEDGAPAPAANEDGAPAAPVA